MNVPRGLIVIFLIVVVVPIGFATFFERVHPMDIGVRQVRWGSGGIEEADFDAGFHLGVWGYHRWYLLPRQTHFLHYSGASTSNRSTSITMWKPALELRTKDNNTTTIDATVTYRILPESAWRIVARGIRLDYRNRVESTVLSVLREELSELSSEELQGTQNRLDRVAEILPILNGKLAEFYVEAENVLIRSISFPPEYEEKLQQKQLLEQKAKLDGTLAVQAGSEQVTNSIEKKIEAAEKEKLADWEKTIQEEKSRFQVLVAEIDARARVYEAQVKAAAEAQAVTDEAEGQLAVDRAEALRNTLRNEILNSRGGDIYLALEAAENIELPSITLNSNDPRVPIVMDLSEMTKLLVGSGGDDSP